MKILSLFLLLFQLPQLPQQPASVDGVVIDSQTQLPLAGATMLVQDGGPSGGKMIMVTGNDGRFTFRDIPPGRYMIEASRSGYVSEMAGTPVVLSNAPQNPFAPLNAPIELTPGQQLSGLRLVLTPGGVISGRLTDERGEVVVGAVVQALRTTHRDGLRERTLAQSVISNDLGEYRFFMLKPGQYFISLSPTTVFNQTILTFSIPLFYPGTIDVKAATPIDLHISETLEGVNFSSIPVRTRRITGGVQGNGSVGVSVVLSPANGTAKKTTTILGDSQNPTFQFSDIVPGPYTLLAVNAYARAVVPIDVRNADVLGTRIIMGPGYKVPTRVRIEGRPPGGPELENVYFTVRAEVPVVGLDADLYSAFGDGHFILDLLEGTHWIDIARAPDYYVKSITLDGNDVLNRGLHVLSSVEGPMEIVVDNHFGEVQGSAGRSNVTVVLVPDAARRNQRPLYKSVRATNGAFHFQKVPPGDYKLFVWSEDTIDNGGPWLDPEYLRKYEDRATPVRVQPDMKTILDRAIPAF